MDNNQNNFEQNFTEPVVPLEPEVKKPLLAVQDPLFLVMCVLISVSIAFSFNIFNLHDFKQFIGIINTPCAVKRNSNFFIFSLNAINRQLLLSFAVKHGAYPVP